MKGLLNVIRTSPSARFILLVWLVLAGWKFSRYAGNDPGNPVTGTVTAWDAYGYYMYLPATFIYDDPYLKNSDWVEKINRTYSPGSVTYQFRPAGEGKQVNIYTCGHALLWSPAFFIAHALAGPLGYSTDGFSLPYQLAVMFSGFIFAALGMIFLRRLLLNRWNERITVLTLVIVLTGTNFPVHGVMESVGPHGIGFMLMAALLLCLDRWTKSNSISMALVAGAILGIAILVRPTAVLWTIIPVLWRITSCSALKEIIRKPGRILYGFIVCYSTLILFGCLQMLYWKSAAGEWIYFPEDIERFTLTDPYTSDFLFSFKKGWLIYTPLMLLLIPGIWRAAKEKQLFLITVMVITVLHIYLLSSWENWWYAESFGQRPMIDIYPLLALPLASLNNWLLYLPKTVARSSYAVIALLTGLNLFQVWQYSRGIIHMNRMSKDFYSAVFLRTAVPLGAEKLLEWNDTGLSDYFSSPSAGQYTKELAFFDMEGELADGKTQFTSDQKAFSGKRSYRMSEQSPFSPTFARKFYEFSSGPYAAIRTECMIWFDSGTVLSNTHIVFNMVTGGRTYGYSTKIISDIPMQARTWNKAEAWYFTPYARHEQDSLMVYLWNAGKGEFFVDDLRITLSEPKPASGSVP
ncbi:MAG: glycosyltransferase family 39 protein [Bacteroidia bacterium]|nr:glycosyltransferase family 39 protein [Bacteroidia bacterium]